MTGTGEAVVVVVSLKCTNYHGIYILRPEIAVLRHSTTTSLQIVCFSLAEATNIYLSYAQPMPTKIPGPHPAAGSEGCAMVEAQRPRG